MAYTHLSLVYQLGLLWSSGMMLLQHLLAFLLHSKNLLKIKQPWLGWSSMFWAWLFSTNTSLGYTAGKLSLSEQFSLDGFLLSGSSPYLFRVRKKPDDLKTSIKQFLFGAGGYGIVAGGFWYHFQKGIVKRHKVSVLEKLPGFFVVPVRYVTHKDILYLCRLLGSKWTIKNNCITKLNILTKDF